MLIKNEMENCNEVNEMKDLTMDREAMEISCVFCGQVFYSVEGVQAHITNIHEGNNVQESQLRKDLNFTKPGHMSLTTSTLVLSPKHLPMSEKLVVYDSLLNVIEMDRIKLEDVKLCTRCNRHFLNEEFLAHHQLMVHAIRKRKRPSNPNSVEGIRVTFEGTWSCDICTRVFATLKQAKVHKFKSHIEPAQKQELLSNTLQLLPSNAEVKLEQTISTQHYRQILPNKSTKVVCSTYDSFVDNITSDTTVIDIGSQLKSEDIEVNTSNAKPEVIWRAKLSDTQETKISFLKITQGSILTKEDNFNTNNESPALNSSTSQFECSHCSSKFSSRAVYSRHIMVHQRGKAFSCDGCGMAFTRNHTLKQHKDSKCVISNPIVGTNCHQRDQCPKCGVYFYSSNSHISHCKKICKVIYGSTGNESARDSVKSDEMNTISDVVPESDINDNKFTLMLNDNAFVTKENDEFICNLCCDIFTSSYSICKHLENYHRVVVKRRISGTSTSNQLEEMCQVNSTEDMSMKRNNSWVTSKNSIADSPPYQKLKSSNFGLPPLIGMETSPEINSISPTKDYTSFSEYKPRIIRKYKVQPNGNGDFECTECHKTFGCRSSLSNHVKSHFNLKNKPFSCGNCNQGFMSHVSYDDHVKNLCSISNDMSITSNMNPSVFSPSSSRSACCMHCNSTFQDRSMLEDHAAKDHATENGEVPCIICSRAFSTYMAFRVHMTKSHGGPNGTPLKHSLTTIMSLPRECSFASLQNAFLASPIQGFNCTKCDKEFNDSIALDSHMFTCVNNNTGDETNTD